MHSAQRLRELEKENNALKKNLSLVVNQLDRARAIKIKPSKVGPADIRPRRRKDKVRICIPDTHGAVVDEKALAIVLADIKALAPDEIILMGDHVDCGGFLAQHHTIGYVAETSYSYEEDIAMANMFLDSVRLAAPNARIEYLEGNHEDRVEGWCITQTLSHQRDADFLRRSFAPEFLLKLKEREIPYYRRSVCYDGITVPGVIKRGKCYFLHGFTAAKHAVAATQLKVAGNVVAAHTHRAQSDLVRRISVGVVGSWNPGCLCYDDQTQVLTDRGFVLFKDMQPDDRVAEFDPATRSVLYRKPLAKQAYAYKGKMVRFSSSRVDLLVTPEHRMLVTKSGKMQTMRADALKLSGSSLKVPLSGKFVGENTGITAEDARLIGWIVSEGSLDTSDYAFRITIYQKKEPQVAQIDMLLRRLGLKFSKKLDKRTGVYGFRICAVDSRKIVARLFNNADIRRLSRDLLRSSLNVLEAAFETLMSGDGSCKGNGSGYYATTSMELADDFQELCHKTGRACAIKKRTADTNFKKDSEIYICGIRNFPNGELFNVTTPDRNHDVDYDGMVYDVTTTTGYFMVRRNGVVCVSGNCKLQPLWQHGNPTDWTQGYGVQLVTHTETFLHLNVPIVGETSLLTTLLGK